MLSAVVYVLFISFILQAESTDIAGVYKQGVIYLKNADTIESLLQSADLYLNLTTNLSYPIALAYDADRENLYVSDDGHDTFDLFQINLQEGYVDVKPVVEKYSKSTIETMIFDPLKHQLLWTDSKKDGIYFAQISNTKSNWEPEVFINKNINNPRGLTLDHCNRILYWTERDKEMRTIEKYNLGDPSTNFFVLKQAKKTKYFQAIDYNSETQELIWSQTDSDNFETSSCRIYSSKMSSGRNVDSIDGKLLAAFDRCYPFSITSDEKFIYWADWGRKGLMRMSREDPNTLIKLVDTPNVKGEKGTHVGLFGIVSINRRPATLCPPQKPTEISTVRTIVDGEIAPELQSYKPLDNIVSLIDKDEYSQIEGKESKDSQFPHIPSSAQSLINSNRYDRQRLIIIVLSASSIFFMSTTMLLLARSCFALQLNNIKNRIITPTLHKPYEQKFSRSKKHRVFKAPNSKTFDNTLCVARSATDGVTIAIEDCCQMTLCDTPCYTSITKEGKGYKSLSKREDKERLLDYALESA